MATRRKSDNDMSNESEAPMPGESTRFRKQTVIVDYNGSVGRATVERGALRNEAAVPHKLSPLLVFWPANGQQDLVLQPGINVVPAELWQFYTETAKSDSGKAGHPQLMALVAAKKIRVLEGLPDDPGSVLSMIKRSMSPEGLKWIGDQERAGEQRDEVLDALSERLAKLRPVDYKPLAFQARVPLIKSGAEAPVMAMG